MKKIISIFFLLFFLFTFIRCKKEKKETKVIEKQEIIKEELFTSYSLLGKRGVINHKKKGNILPFENSYLPAPDTSVYQGNLFSLRHDYPLSSTPLDTLPWKQVTNNGAITRTNAYDYVQAIKSYVSDDMTRLLYKYDQWNPSKEPWFQSIWLGNVREPIHGMYVGSSFPAGTLTPSQTAGLTTYVYTLYDQTSAVTLNKIWGQNKEKAYNPNLSSTEDAQFAEGSVIVKFAFVSLQEYWPPMENAATWDVYTDVAPGKDAPGTSDTVVRKLYLMQFDMIVKDSTAAPETGWVFSTLVYDKDNKGETAWDRMVPLGATWGNNPKMIDTTAAAIGVPSKVNKALTENWINMASPAYSRATLGWDGRLSGPNDGAVVSPAVTQSGKKYEAPHGLSTVGCLGCHSSAQYKFKSFLLPAVKIPSETVPLVLYDPGSTGWMKWFSNRNGTEPMDAGQISLDYDMVTAFKAIPAWQKALEKQKELQ
ncbi:hypothetical protein [Aquimarina longa]|uniref:hypothetical protein n=1 Tax=Aquimarina longa TaxID=1080221 RepID=UPI000784F38C|nr:hypothetical protein [Aquimarina longa]